MLRSDPGNGVTISLLRNFGYSVNTIDFDLRLKPDINCSVLELKQRFQKTFDVTLCFQVLEHLKFEDFDVALDNINSITGKYAILSLPYAGLTLKLSAYVSKYGERKIEFVKRFPLFWEKHKFDEEHYWEIGKKGYSRKRIRKAILKHFCIEKEWLFPYNNSQIFYKCKKRLFS